jgi:hypothetical protein
MVIEPTTVAELMTALGGAETFAREVGMKRSEHARTMRRRGTINERWWDAVVLAASRRGVVGITHSVLARINERHAEKMQASRKVIATQPEIAA